MMDYYLPTNHSANMIMVLLLHYHILSIPGQCVGV